MVALVWCDLRTDRGEDKDRPYLGAFCLAAAGGE